MNDKNKKNVFKHRTWRPVGRTWRGDITNLKYYEKGQSYRGKRELTPIPCMEKPENQETFGVCLTD